jgi:hypothetical protein
LSGPIVTSGPHKIPRYLLADRFFPAQNLQNSWGM